VEENMATSGNGRTTVDFYFDPICPWAWRTSLWIREVAKVRPIDVRWKFLSLEEINRPAGTLKESHLQSRGPFRAMALARRLGGEEAVDRLYLALGKARHERKEDLSEASVVTAALQEAGLSPDLLEEAMGDPSTEEEYLAEHRAVVEQGGFGVATLVIGGCEPMFGPVIDDVPSGEEAGRLFDHVADLCKLPYFFELKRGRA
jgi:2-hydroxychromene-2-carboxylate isomerase